LCVCLRRWKSVAEQDTRSTDTLIYYTYDILKSIDIHTLMSKDSFIKLLNRAIKKPKSEKPEPQKSEPKKPEDYNGKQTR
jgi:hypothetical protein